MNEGESEVDELQFCPICQVPLKLLKVLFSVHIGMCDIIWSELPDCSHGNECNSENVFHYRDFSHEKLAHHRENLRKRKISEVNDAEISCCENGNKISKKQEPENTNKNILKESEDDIFMPTTCKKVTSLRNQKLKTSISKDSRMRKQKIGKSVSHDQTMKEQSSCKVVDTNKSSSKIGEKFAENTSVKNEESEIFERKKSLELQEAENNTLANFSGSCIEEKVDLIETYQDNFSSELLMWGNIESQINEKVDKKEKCKAQWNNLFKGKSGQAKTDTEISRRKNKKSNSMFSAANERKPCPSFKKMPGTGFAVDAFQFGNIPGVTIYFLTHFHSDHYIGLKKSFSNPIYCSLITANLVKKKLRVDEKYLRVLELDQPVIINQVEVTFFDANHCPGAVLILFRLTNGEQFLHVGDFRACEEMEHIPQLQNTHIDKLYLDTTYFNPNYVFPTQKEVIDRVKTIVREKSRNYVKALFVSGTYLIGKEKVFIGILEELQCKLWAQAAKVDVFRCINNPVILSALTSVPEEANVHVLPMNHLKFDRLKKYLLDMNGAFSHIFAFKPTGWEMGRTVTEDWINESSNQNVTIYGVPYSEHSNFKELCRFVEFIKADKVIPTVPMKDRQSYGLLKSIVDSYKVGPKQQNIEQFFNTL